MKKLLAGAAIALTTLAGIAQADGHTLQLFKDLVA